MAKRLLGLLLLFGWLVLSEAHGHVGTKTEKEREGRRTHLTRTISSVVTAAAFYDSRHEHASNIEAVALPIHDLTACIPYDQQSGDTNCMADVDVLRWCAHLVLACPCEQR
jgi:hypothetical protein